MHTPNKIVVALSGGVDSSVAALLLKRAGADLVGISMQVWDYRQNGGARSRVTCCAPNDFLDARQVAFRLDIPYYVFDFEHTFRRQVIDKFVQSYARGLTPNPCVDCNNKVKFRELRERSTALGVSAVATGHYARLERTGKEHLLLRAVDTEKDQSYFLYGLKREELPYTAFPIGYLTKPEVRALAREAGFSTADKAESQDICFVAGSVQDFLVTIGGKRPRGWLCDRKGAILGQHDGIHNFTVGQRRGVGVSGMDEPLYVIEIDAATNSVILGSKKDLERESFQVNECNWLAAEIVEALEHSQECEIDCFVQVRHRHRGVRAIASVTPSGDAQVILKHENLAVTPGQAAVFYDKENTRVLGGGTIVQSSKHYSNTVAAQVA